MARRTRRGGKRAARAREYRRETQAATYEPTPAALKLRGVGIVASTVGKCATDTDAGRAAAARVDVRTAHAGTLTHGDVIPLAPLAANVAARRLRDRGRRDRVAAAAADARVRAAALALLPDAAAWRVSPEPFPASLPGAH